VYVLRCSCCCSTHQSTGDQESKYSSVTATAAVGVHFCCWLFVRMFTSGNSTHQSTGGRVRPVG
jgi:hypothetical protein